MVVLATPPFWFATARILTTRSTLGPAWFGIRIGPRPIVVWSRLRGVGPKHDRRMGAAGRPLGGARRPCARRRRPGAPWRPGLRRVDDVLLVASELAANAVRHGQSSGRCCGSTTRPQRIRVTVSNHGGVGRPGGPRCGVRRGPWPRPGDGAGAGRRRRLAARWRSSRRVGRVRRSADLSCHRAVRRSRARPTGSARRPREAGPPASGVVALRGSIHGRAEVSKTVGIPRMHSAA